MIATRVISAAALALVSALPPVAIRPFVRGSWQQIRREHAGRPAIVHFWGLTCAPCLAELPQWGRLLGEQRGTDLVFVAADAVPEEPAHVSSMLTKAALSTAENWMFADHFVDRLVFEVDPEWQGELPITILVAGDGTTSKIVGTVDFAAIRGWIDRHAR
jgi:thiol-disulfide isomerase/thioredoxin